MMDKLAEMTGHEEVMLRAVSESFSAIRNDIKINTLTPGSEPYRSRLTALIQQVADRHKVGVTKLQTALVESLKTENMLNAVNDSVFTIPTDAKINTLKPGTEPYRNRLRVLVHDIAEKHNVDFTNLHAELVEALETDNMLNAVMDSFSTLRSDAKINGLKPGTEPYRKQLLVLIQRVADYNNVDVTKLHAAMVQALEDSENENRASGLPKIPASPRRQALAP